MTFTPPATPVTLTPITVAFYTVNIKDNINHLRALLPDAGGANYWLQSSATTAAVFVDRAIAVLAALGYTPVNKAGDTMSNDLTFGAASKGVRFYGNGATPSGVIDIGTQGLVFNVHADSLEIYDQALAVQMARFFRSAGTSFGWIGGNEIWHDGNTTNKVTQSKLADGAVGTAELIDGNVSGPKLTDGQVGTLKFTDGSVTQPKLANNSVGTAQLRDGEVSGVKLTDGQVGTAKLTDGNVTAPKLAAGVAASNLGFTPARIAASSYVGDGSGTQAIVLGWTPSVVFIHNPATGVGIYHNSGDRTTLGYSGNIVAGGTGGIVSGGFNAILGANNASGTTYFYVALG